MSGEAMVRPSASSMTKRNWWRDDLSATKFRPKRFCSRGAMVSRVVDRDADIGLVEGELGGREAALDRAAGAALRAEADIEHGEVDHHGGLARVAAALGVGPGVFEDAPHPGQELGVAVAEGRALQAGEQVGALPVGEAGGELVLRTALEIVVLEPVDVEAERLEAAGRWTATPHPRSCRSR